MSIINGYKKLKEDDNLDYIISLKSKILDKKILVNNNDFSKFVFCINKENFSNFLTQGLFCKFILVKEFNEQILLNVSNGIKFSIPIPDKWLEIISNESIKISKFNIKKKYISLCLMSLISGFLYGVKKILFNKYYNNKQPYIYFSNLSYGDLPLNKNENYDTISWFIKFFSFKKKVKYIFHNVNNDNIILDKYIIKRNNNLFNLNLFALLFQFLPWFISSLFISFLNIFNKNGYEAFFFKNAIDLKLSQLCKQNFENSYFFFNNSSSILRDLWTYNIEKNKGNVFFYFYSINNYPLSKKKQTFSLWRNMTWNNYLTWNSYNTKFVINANIYKPNIFCLGPIWNSGSKKKFIEPTKYIAVFDITPLNDIDRMTLALGHEFLTTNQLINFINDIYKVCKMNNLKLILKSKKKVSEKLNKNYFDFINIMRQDSHNFSFLDSEFSSIDVIKNSEAVISFPYTSTAHQAKIFDKPSIFYESTGYINENSVASNGIKTIIGINKLSNWAKSIVNEKS